MFFAFDASVRPASASKAVTELLEALSPRLMHLGDDLWLIDLKPCLGYWQHQAEQRGATTEDLWRQILIADAGDIYRAAVATLPWQALLLTLALRERGLSGLIADHLPLGRKIYQDLTWPTWWRGVAVVTPHLQRAARKFDAAGLKRRSGQMRRALKRLSIKRPVQLKSATTLSVRRRFGATLGDLWNWTLGEREPAFPWFSEDVAPAPTVTRHLEHPVMRWTELEESLRDDFNRLCQREVAPGRRGILPEQRVLSFAWTLTRDDLSVIPLKITFRHPHPIHKESPAQKTAILQAMYAFEALQKPTDDEDIPNPPIVGWQLAVESWLRLMPFSGSLFRDEDGDGEDLAQLAALENLLPVALQRLRARADHLPEDSQEILRFAQDDGVATPEHAAAAAIRPLFIWDKPRLWHGAEEAEHMQFLERVSDKWWRHPGRRQRDYFRVTDRYGKVLWAFQDHLGRWFLHGLYA
jgi:hypothetical protein